LAAADAVPPDALPSPSTVSLPPPLFAWRDLVDSDQWSEVPTDVPTLLALLPRADLYVQDEVDIRLHPTLTRCWSRRGRRGQRLVRAPGQSFKVVGFGAVDWRDGWFSHGIARGRTADAFCAQLDHLVARSQERGRVAIVLADNLGIHTPRGSKKLREALERHGDALRLVYTPAYDPDANPMERLWRPFRRLVTHNHHRDCLINLYDDARRCFAHFDRDPRRIRSFIGASFAHRQSDASSAA
jgi:hypothetical protein